MPDTHDHLTPEAYELRTQNLLALATCTPYGEEKQKLIAEAAQRLGHGPEAESSDDKRDRTIEAKAFADSLMIARANYTEVEGIVRCVLGNLSFTVADAD